MKLASQTDFWAYGTWGEANNAAIGYKTELEVFDRRADKFRDGKEEPPMDVPALLAAISMASPARVLDFGGGTAFGYLCASGLLLIRYQTGI